MPRYRTPLFIQTFCLLSRASLSVSWHSMRLSWPLHLPQVLISPSSPSTWDSFRECIYAELEWWWPAGISIIQHWTPRGFDFGCFYHILRRFQARAATLHITYQDRRPSAANNPPNAHSSSCTATTVCLFCNLCSYYELSEHCGPCS